MLLVTTRPKTGQLGADDDRSALLRSIAGTGAVEAEEEDEREQDGADDERRHGGGQAAAAALIGRRQRQGRGMLLLQLVPLLHAPLYWPLPPVLCSALPPLPAPAAAPAARWWGW